MDKTAKAYEVTFLNTLTRAREPFAYYGFGQTFAKMDDARRFADNINIVSTVKHLHIKAEIKPIYE